MVADSLTKLSEFACHDDDRLAEDCVALRLHLEYIEATAAGAPSADDGELRRRLGHVVHFVLLRFVPHIQTVGALADGASPVGRAGAAGSIETAQTLVSLAQELVRLSGGPLDAHRRAPIRMALYVLQQRIRLHLEALEPGVRVVGLDVCLLRHPDPVSEGRRKILGELRCLQERDGSAPPATGSAPSVTGSGVVQRMSNLPTPSTAPSTRG